MVCCLLFFTDTATTETYTYVNTSSLHDALPICLAWQTEIHKDTKVPVGQARRGNSTIAPRRSWRSQFRRLRTSSACRNAYRERSVHGSRSEEHTSELQSLMRISYAVFCLKHKKKRQQQNSITL